MTHLGNYITEEEFDNLTFSDVCDLFDSTDSGTYDECCNEDWSEEKTRGELKSILKGAGMMVEREVIENKRVGKVAEYDALKKELVALLEEGEKSGHKHDVMKFDNTCNKLYNVLSELEASA